ncbi:MAG: helix-turn-helix domain-containing protein [Chloroflexota bacterium]|nr:helix-turn-helix domain-containing protein [Chloroflexota bacterium]
MPWQEVSIMALRRDFVAMATQEGPNRRALCRHFGISPTTGYRWLRRYQTHGLAGLHERSRQGTVPRASPGSASNDRSPMIGGKWPSRDPFPCWRVGAVIPCRSGYCAWGVRVIHGRPYHPQTQGSESLA